MMFQKQSTIDAQVFTSSNVPFVVYIDKIYSQDFGQTRAIIEDTCPRGYEVVVKNHVLEGDKCLGLMSSPLKSCHKQEDKAWVKSEEMFWMLPSHSDPS